MDYEFLDQMIFNVQKSAGVNVFLCRSLGGCRGDIVPFWCSAHLVVALKYQPVPSSLRVEEQGKLTVRCWKSHALMMLVATFGKIPLFLLCFFSLSGSSSSPVLGEATLLSRPSPVT